MATLRDHALLGFRVNHLDGVWINQIAPDTHPFLEDHVVDGQLVFPAAAFAEIALAASSRLFKRHYHEIAGLEIRRPLIFERGTIQELQVVVSPDDFTLTIRSRTRLSGDSWVLNAVGTLVHGAREFRPTALSPEQLLPPADAAGSIDGKDIYEIATGLGLQYGPTFQRVRRVWLDENSAVAELESTADDGQTGYELQPAIIDAAFHTLLPALAPLAEETRGSPYLPISIGTLRKYAATDAIQHCRCTILSRSSRGLDASFVLSDEAGRIVAELDHCVFRKLPGRSSKPQPSFYSFRQVPKNHIDGSVISPLPSLESITDEADRPRSRRVTPDEDRIFVEQVLPLYDALAAALAERTLKQIGAHLGGFTIDGLLSESGIATKHARFVAFLMSILEEDGKARCDDGVWQLIAESEDDDAIAIWRSIAADHPRYLPEMLLTARRGFNLLPLLVGDTAATTHDLESSMDNAHRTHLNAIHEVIRQTTVGWPKERRRLRIAEFRGPTGSDFSKEILSLLHRDYCDYELIVTDEITKLQCEQRFRRRPNVKVTLADGEHGIDCEFRDAEFDLVIGNEWLHQCPDILKSLAHITRLLTAGGMLLLVEPRPDRLTDINHGIDPDWWARALDEDRPASRLMGADEWLIALEKAGFSKSRLVTDAVQDTRHAVIASAWSAAGKQTADETSEHGKTWLLLSDASGASLSVAKRLKEDLSSRGDQALLIEDGDAAVTESVDHLTLDTAQPADFEYLIEHLRSHNIESTNLVFLLGLEATDKASALQSIDSQSRRCMALAHLVRAFEQSSPESRPRFWVVTSGATSQGTSGATDGFCNPTQATLWGFGRVVKNEFPFLDSADD